MSTARELFDDGNRWTDERTRQALPILLLYARTGQRSTYGKLNVDISTRYNVPPMRFVVRYSSVLEKIGMLINRLSDEWHQEIPPLTILIYNGDTMEPSSGVNNFLNRYTLDETGETVTAHNRKAMIDRATDAVHNYTGWDAVAAYFGVTIPGNLAEAHPIPLPVPQPIMGGESDAHIALKTYVASHPELFRRFGQFGTGEIEAKLRSGDEVDVLFHNDEQTLAVEVKTADAAPGEITRGLFQCVKYRAVLRAMHNVDGILRNVRVVLVTPKPLSDEHLEAAERFGVIWRQVDPPKRRTND